MSKQKGVYKFAVMSKLRSCNQVNETNVPVPIRFSGPSLKIVLNSQRFVCRYGAAMALGIACAGTGSKKALALIEPMTNDSVNYVRQGALIASALILIQHTETTCPKVKHFR